MSEEQELKRCPFCGGAFEWSGRLECWVCWSADSGCEVDVRASRYISESVTEHGRPLVSDLNCDSVEEALKEICETIWDDGRGK